jgi:photosystem II stability/assembly factor-like uncharacterized protein
MATESPNDVFWWAIASSASGSNLVALSDGIYVSTNSGNSWNKADWPSANQSAVISADGKKMAVAARGGLIYTSSDSGKTWMATSAPNENWWTISSSADGNKLAAGVWNGGIFSLYSAPAPQLNLRPLNGNLTLSWTVPSTNFVLQQSADMTAANWTDITNQLALNPTNLLNEVTLPISGNRCFYRLKTP